MYSVSPHATVGGCVVTNKSYNQLTVDRCDIIVNERQYPFGSM